MSARVGGGWDGGGAGGGHGGGDWAFFFCFSLFPLLRVVLMEFNLVVVHRWS